MALRASRTPSHVTAEVPELLRIAQVAPYFRPHVGGVESHVESVARELARRGHDVRVLTSRLEGTPREEAFDGVKVERVPMAANFLTTPVTPSLTKRLRALDLDVMHSHSPPPVTSYLAARASRERRVPHVLTYHCDLEVAQPWGPALVRAYGRTFGARTLAAADAVIATTETYAKTSHMLWRRSDVRVIPNMVDADRFRPDVDGARVRERHGLGERPVALFVGRLTRHKGLEHFVRAARSTPADVVHLVVGDGPRRGAIERLAADLKVDSKVIFAGRAEPADLPAYYAAATVAVLPSTSRLEAFGIAALEAMASGRPVVVSRIPGVNEVILPGETGLHAEPLDAEDLAAQIGRLVGDAELAASMGKRARAWVLERFTTRRVVDAIEQVYRDVTARGAESA